MQDSIRSELLAMSRNLGNPALDYAILGEGNSSARADADTFWVKASGAALQTLQEKDLIRVRFDVLSKLVNDNVVEDGAVRAGLEAARVDPTVTALPSVETFLHALVLQVEGINFVGHTHPTAINSILCSQKVDEAIAGRLFPDEIVYCGPAPVYIPYTDPGLPLARAVRNGINKFIDVWGEAPKVILMQNHGFIALGKSALEVENITAMAVKAARVLIGTYALGGPHFLDMGFAERIRSRPDEHYRQKLWSGKSTL
jgi:rhamnose utilization protein RhaD (predicted bifunctional aldolase and dehydrogenase)